MDCERANRENIVERYLAGKLDPATIDEWEGHLFACDRCAERLELCQTITPVLREMAPEIRREMQPAKPARRWLWIALPLAAAAMFAFTLVDWAPKPKVAVSSTPDYTLLAKLDPPAYHAPTLRSVPAPAQTKFRDAMTAYQAHDWSRAIEGLKASLELDSAAAAPRFFLGASYLLSGNPQAAAIELAQVATSDSPFAEEARFDLAKAFLAQGRKEEALTALQQCHGDFAPQAADLITRIQGVSK
jgi:tetratricopeptide (TPR) repeat protein